MWVTSTPPGFYSQCTVDVGSDPFTTYASHQARAGTLNEDPDNDLTVVCTVDFRDLIEVDSASPTPASTANLLNVCTYPSGPPNNDAKDCVVSPGTGRIIIAKVADPDDGTKFTFYLDGDTSNPIELLGTDQVATAIPVLAGLHSIEEVVPENWQLDSASCTDLSGTLSEFTLSGIDVAAGEQITCTFYDSL